MRNADRHRHKWCLQFARIGEQPKLKPGKKARKEREKAGEDAVDGRSLKATGRTEHCNLRCTPEVKAAFHRAAKEAGLGLSIWLEKAILAAIERQNRAMVDLAG
jgi:hypothetical protein